MLLWRLRQSWVDGWLVYSSRALALAGDFRAPLGKHRRHMLDRGISKVVRLGVGPEVMNLERIMAFLALDAVCPVCNEV